MAHVTFRQSKDFPPQYGNFFASAGHLLILRRRCSFAQIAGIELASTGFSLNVRRGLAPRGQQAAMRGLRLSLSWSVTDKVS
jgi:hypothetical protein